jgi:ferredoxin
LLNYLRTALGRFREAGGTEPILVFYDSASEEALADGLAAALPENALPVQLEEVGSLGMDAWFTCLAYGARRILVLTGATSPPSVAEVLGREIAVAGAILGGMGYPDAAVQLVSAEDGDALIEAAGADAVIDLERPAKFAAPPEKSLLLQTAVNHLLEAAPNPKKSVSLPAGAAFGQVKVDGDACTLCMSCVAVCPASALREGQGLPQLNFVESCCVQCRLCEKACPEDAISLEPRFLYDQKQRQARRLLYEEQPLCCISCGKPFATRSMMKVMERKLADHWMFQKDEERRRLEMCEDCRVKDLMRAQSGGGPSTV